MTVGEIKDQVMFQTNNDIDDVEDFEPYLLEYINDGYDRLVYAYTKTHILDEAPEEETDEDTVVYTRLLDNMEEPALPLRYHSALADWATWLVYRNGNPQKQQRGWQFRESFESVLRNIMSQGSKTTRFRNMPR